MSAGRPHKCTVRFTNMKNTDVAWIIVRAFGIYFLAQAFLELLSVISQVGILMAIDEIIHRSNASEQRVMEAESQLIRAKMYLGVYIAQLVTFGLLAFYCLRHGALILKLMTYRKGSSEQT